LQREGRGPKQPSDSCGPGNILQTVRFRPDVVQSYNQKQIIVNKEITLRPRAVARPLGKAHVYGSFHFVRAGIALYGSVAEAPGRNRGGKSPKARRMPRILKLRVAAGLRSKRLLRE